MSAAAATVEEVSPAELQWVHAMIGDIEAQETREDFARRFFQWDFVVREFRKVEQRRITLGQTEADWRLHALCLHSLLAIGHDLVTHSRELSAAELKRFGAAHDDIAAYVAELEQSLRESHHGFAAAEVAQAQEAIFGAAS